MIGNMIKYMRLSRKITQKDMASRLYIAPCTLSHYETNIRMIPYETFFKIMTICEYDFKILDCYTGEDITKLEINYMTEG